MTVLISCLSVHKYSLPRICVNLLLELYLGTFLVDEGISGRCAEGMSGRWVELPGVPSRASRCGVGSRPCFGWISNVGAPFRSTLVLKNMPNYIRYVCMCLLNVTHTWETENFFWTCLSSCLWAFLSIPFHRHLNLWTNLNQHLIPHLPPRKPYNLILIWFATSKYCMLGYGMCIKTRPNYS